ncbi:MAG: hypothetical protein ABTQ34_03195 [Bdellovibrionales bacterium]
MVGNMLINREHHPDIATAYGIGLAAHILAKIGASNRPDNHMLQFAASPPGCLAMNAGLTLSAGFYAHATGGPTLLASAMVCFGTANGVQSAIFGNVLKLKDNARNFALTACELCMTGGFACLLAYSGAPTWEVGAGIMTNVAMVAARTKQCGLNLNIHPDLLYADMLAMAGITAYEAVASGHPWVAASRGMAAIALTMLAGDRATSMNMRSYLDVRQLPENVKDLKAYVSRRWLPSVAAPK